MVLRVDAIQARLRRLEEVVTDLRELATLDPEKVEEALATAPRDFDDFALAIRRWLEGQAI